MADFRALCSELVEVLVDEYGYCAEYRQGLPLTPSVVSELLTRARAALAEGDGVGPTDEEIRQVYCESMELTSSPASLGPMPVMFGRAILARYGTTHPRSIPPLDATRQLILRLTAELARLHDSDPPTLDLIAEARAFIDAAHPRPIPVSERPWERDGFCDVDGRFWAGWTDFPSAGTVAGWTLCRADQVDGDETHALPAAAIQLPEAKP